MLSLPRGHHEHREIRTALHGHPGEGTVRTSIQDVERIFNEEYEIEKGANLPGYFSDDTSNQCSTEGMVSYGLSHAEYDIEQIFSDNSSLHGFQQHYLQEMEHMIQ